MHNLLTKLCVGRQTETMQLKQAYLYFAKKLAN